MKYILQQEKKFKTKDGGETAIIHKFSGFLSLGRFGRAVQCDSKNPKVFGSANLARRFRLLNPELQKFKVTKIEA